MILAQIPGADQAINAAVEQGSWEAVVLVVIMLSCVGFLVYIVRTIMTQAMAREERLAKRIDILEDYIRTSLMQAMKENTQAMLGLTVQNTENTKALTDLIEALHTTRICFATGDQQAKLVETIANRVVREIGKTGA